MLCLERSHLLMETQLNSKKKKNWQSVIKNMKKKKLMKMIS